MGISTKAVGQGRIAARAMDAYLSGKEYKKPNMGTPVKPSDMRLDYYPPAERNEETQIETAEAIAGFTEIKQTISTQQALNEAARCMSCGLCDVCDQCRVYCPQETIYRDKKRPKGKVMFTEYTACTGCHVCFEACPTGYIQMGMGL